MDFREVAILLKNFFWLKSTFEFFRTEYRKELLKNSRIIFINCHANFSTYKYLFRFLELCDNWNHAWSLAKNLQSCPTHLSQLFLHSPMRRSSKLLLVVTSVLNVYKFNRTTSIVVAISFWVVSKESIV